MPNLGHVVDSDELIRLHPGFHQRYEKESKVRQEDRMEKEWTL